MKGPGPMVAAKRWFRNRTTVLIVLAIAGFLFVYPVVMLIIGAFRNADPVMPAQWGFQSFVEVYTNPRTYSTFGNSLFLAVTTTTIAVLVALYMAFLSARTTTPLRKLITPAMVVVLALPPTFFAISWGMLGNKRVGTINTFFQGFFGDDFSLMNTNSWFGIIFVTVLHMIAVSYLLLIGPFTALDRNLEEAAHVAGAGGLRTFFSIDLPVLAPTIIGVTILEFVKGLEAFDVPILLGTPARITVVATEIYGQIQDNVPPNYGAASALSIVLLVIVIGLVLVQWKMLGKRQFTTVTGKSFRQDRWEIGAGKYVGTFAIVAYLLLAVIMPGLQLLYGALQPFFGAKFGMITFENFEKALTSPELVDAITLTIMLAAVCGVLAAGLSAVVSYLIARSKSRMTKLIELAVWLPWALPGVVLSLAFAWAFLAVPGLRSLFGTPWILILALTVSAIPIAMRPVQGAIAQLSTELEDAARTSGASSSRTFLGIVLRIILPSFFGAWLVSAIVVSGNLAVPTLLSGLGNKTVPMLVFTLYRDGHVTQSAALLLVHMCLTFLILGGLWLVYRVLLGIFKGQAPSTEISAGDALKEPEQPGPGATEEVPEEDVVAAR